MKKYYSIALVMFMAFCLVSPLHAQGQIDEHVRGSLLTDLMATLQLHSHLIVGSSMLIFFNWFVVWFYRIMFVGRLTIKSSKGWLWARSTEYERAHAVADSWQQGDQAGLIFLFAIAFFGGNSGLLAVACH